jgi:hypothetical protein
MGSGGKVSLVAYNTAFTSELVRLQRSYIDASKPLTAEMWAGRSRAWTLLDNVAQLVALVP